MIHLSIDQKEFNKVISQFGEIGRQNGGLWRSAYTPEEGRAKTFLKKLMKEHHISPKEDSVGNLYGISKTSKMSADNKSILIGSHIDTVRNAGILDGALGVLAGIIAVSSLVKQLGPPRKPVEIVGLIEEEASRFYSGFLGSRAIVYGLTQADLSEQDSNGISVAEAMSSAGYNPKKAVEAKRNDIDAYLEMHIEQGPILELNQKKIGIVKTITGFMTLNVEIHGEENHAGTTPMEARQDALVAACEIIRKIPDTVQKISKTARATVGMIRVIPGSTNVIPGKTRFSIDIRDTVEKGIEKIKGEIVSLLDNTKRLGFTVLIEETAFELPISLDSNLVETLETVCQQHGVPAMKMNSGAGHDAQIIAKRFPAALLFIPSRKGISHSPQEYSDPEDIYLGTQILAEMLKTLAW